LPLVILPPVIAASVEKSAMEGGVGEPRH